MKQHLVISYFTTISPSGDFCNQCIFLPVHAPPPLSAIPNNKCEIDIRMVHPFSFPWVLEVSYKVLKNRGGFTSTTWYRNILVVCKCQMLESKQQSTIRNKRSQILHLFSIPLLSGHKRWVECLLWRDMFNKPAMISLPQGTECNLPITKIHHGFLSLEQQFNCMQKQCLRLMPSFFCPAVPEQSFSLLLSKMKFKLKTRFLSNYVKASRKKESGNARYANW